MWSWWLIWFRQSAGTTDISQIRLRENLCLCLSFGETLCVSTVWTETWFKRRPETWFINWLKIRIPNRSQHWEKKMCTLSLHHQLKKMNNKNTKNEKHDSVFIARKLYCPRVNTSITPRNRSTKPPFLRLPTLIFLHKNKTPFWLPENWTVPVLNVDSTPR